MLSCLFSHAKHYLDKQCHYARACTHTQTPHYFTVYKLSISLIDILCQELLHLVPGHLLREKATNLNTGQAFTHHRKRRYLAPKLKKKRALNCIKLPVNVSTKMQNQK